MVCGLTLKAAHVRKLRQLDREIEEQQAAREALTTETEEHAAASESKQEELREDIVLTQKHVAELNESWGIMRDMYETSKRTKKLREKALMRKVIGRFMYATLAKCVKEWAGLTFRRKLLAARHQWQAKAEDLEFEEKSLHKQLVELGNKLHFLRDAVKADRVRALVARMGFRSLGMWFLMWRAYLKVSADEQRAAELQRLRQQIQDTEDHSKRLAKKVADQAEADERMSGQINDIVAADTARHSSVLPAVLTAAVAAQRIALRQFAKYPSGSRSSGLHTHMRTLGHSGSALNSMGGIADQDQADAAITLPAIAGAVPSSPPVPPGPPEPPAPSPQSHWGNLSVEESIVNDLSTSNTEDVPVAPKAHQRSRPFNSRGRTLVQPTVEDVRELSLPGGASAMRGSTRRELTVATSTKETQLSNESCTDSRRQVRT